MDDLVNEITGRAQKASTEIAFADSEKKDRALHEMASLLEEKCNDIVKANKSDLKEARKAGIRGSLLDRLVFDKNKVLSRVVSLIKIAALPDPIGQIFDQQKVSNGLLVGRMRVPLGVILMIYEARPHVTVNAGAFALKSGNSIICKGGSEAKHCNALLDKLWRTSLEKAGLPGDAIQIVSLTHEQVDEMLTLKDRISLVIPRGGKSLIRSVAEKSRIPVVKHFEGVCHVYIGELADTEKALPIVLDSKLLMPAVCNAAETVLVDSSVKWWLPLMVSALIDNGIEVRGCPLVCEDVSTVKPATEEDWYTEYLDKIYSVKVVDNIDQAIDHIAKYGSGHTDVIVTENYSHAHKFVNRVDSSVVMVNASTMFCDGETLGMGAEIGISTDKFHARGPMGLNELTSYKHVIYGNGQIMG
jgi:glutamate-5-semialdehyde dehydrogenase